VIVATMGYAGGAVLSRRLLSNVDSTVLAASQTAIAFVVLTPLLLVAEGPPSVGEFSGDVFLATLGLGLGSTGVAYVLYYWLIANTDATRAALVTYLLPVTALGWGWLVLDEGVKPAFVPGLALIIAGIALVNRRPGAVPVPAAAPLPAVHGDD
jgi:drug/metabolite transporter (DMT)-like permease